MSELFAMLSVVSREKMTDFYALYRKHGVPNGLVSLGYGTAGHSVRGYLGLENQEKAIICAAVTGETWKKLKAALVDELYINIPNTGIAMLIPLASIAGRRELRFLTEEQNYEKGEESVLKDTEWELLVIICNQGQNEFVMDAAREAGAAGGTVLHARGTGRKKQELFFGFSLASEKDVLLIAVQAEKKNAIMQAVMEKAGMASKAKSIIMSLPVTDTAGIRWGTAGDA